MEKDSMRNFLSSENIGIHKEYLKKLKLKYSVLTKSDPRLLRLDIFDMRRKLPRSDIKSEAMSLLSEILSHEIYFSSFSDKRIRCPRLCERYGSENSFLYELFSAAKPHCHGFLYIFSDKLGVRYEISDGNYIFKNSLPCLAVDLYEHAYFQDYRFDRERYLEAAISNLDLSKITEIAKKD